MPRERVVHGCPASRLARLGLLSLLLAPAARATAGTADPKPEWSQGASLCAGAKVEQGWAQLAQVEQRAGKKPLPAAYWREVLACASRAGMPAHALRAGKMLEVRQEATAADRQLVQQARAARRAPDPKLAIPPSEAWTPRNAGGGVQIVSGPCGLSFRVHADPPQLPAVQNQTCSVRVFGKPFKGKGGSLQPNLVLLARPAGPGEKLEDWLVKLLPTWKPATARDLRCPGAGCLTFGNRIPKIYGKDGDGIGLAIGFEREEPEFPGLAFEVPRPPAPAGGAEPPALPANPTVLRYPGRMMYLVMLDTPATGAKAARAELQTFLSELLLD